LFFLFVISQSKHILIQVVDFITTNKHVFHILSAIYVVVLECESNNT